MKFTKDEAYKDLVAKMTAKGEKLNLSDRSINEQLETLMTLIANDETELNDLLWFEPEWILESLGISDEDMYSNED